MVILTSNIANKKITVKVCSPTHWKQGNYDNGKRFPSPIFYQHDNIMRSSGITNWIHQCIPQWIFVWSRTRKSKTKSTRFSSSFNSWVSMWYALRIHEYISHGWNYHYGDQWPTQVQTRPRTWWSSPEEWNANNGWWGQLPPNPITWVCPWWMPY